MQKKVSWPQLLLGGKNYMSFNLRHEIAHSMPFEYLSSRGFSLFNLVEFCCIFSLRIDFHSSIHYILPFCEILSYQLPIQAWYYSLKRSSRNSEGSALFSFMKSRSSSESSPLSFVFTITKFGNPECFIFFIFLPNIFSPFEVWTMDDKHWGSVMVTRNWISCTRPRTARSVWTIFGGCLPTLLNGFMPRRCTGTWVHIGCWPWSLWTAQK